MNLIDIGLYVAYLLLFAVIATLILFPVFGLLKGNFGKAKGSLLGIGILIVAFLLAYFLSPADQGAFYEKMNIGPQGSKVIGAGLLVTYFMGIAFVVITLYTSVVKWFK